MKKSPLNDPFAEREASKYDKPVASRELISDVLNKSSGPMSHTAICKYFDISSDEQVEALRRRLIAMERDGQLIRNRKGAYGLVDKMDLIRGCVQGHREGYGFVVPAEGGADIYLSNRQMRKVFDGDEVLVRSDGTNANGKREGSIVEVLAHNTLHVVGRYVDERGVLLVKPDNPRIVQDILIAPEESLKAANGQFVVVEILQQPSRYQRPIGRVIEVLGDHMAPGMEIDVAIRTYDIPHIWPEDVKKQAETFSETVAEADKKGRIDLRNLPLMTIDGEDARDFDDAVYCERKKSGGWRLYVAIADVSHYVKKDSALDQEAYLRSTSVYFPDHVVPMLPHVLSNGLCSLNPKVDRLCMVCEMTVSAAGKVSGFSFYEAVMHSHARMTYTQVGQIIDERHDPKSQYRKQFSPLLKHIDDLHDLYVALKARRDERGAINFETQETRIIFDEERKIDRIVPVERNEAHKLIEECMLAANVSAAKMLESLNIPTLYRVHEGPQAEKLEKLYAFLSELGIQISKGKELTPQMYGEVLAKTQHRPDANIIQTVMLRSMNQAVYQPKNLGHFGLAYSAYAHFTSPIRRYPDLLVHRALRALLQSNYDSRKVKRKGKHSKAKSFEAIYPYSQVDMLDFGEHTSLCERRADDATRDVLSWLKCEYLKNRVGEEFDGVVSAVTGFGLFVELKDLYVEGLIHVTGLPQDYYHYEAAKHRMVGERTRQVFKLGDALRVKVTRVNLDERKVDFELLDAIETSSRKSKKKQGQTSQKKDAPAAKDGRAIRKRKVKSSESESKNVTKNKNKTKKVAVKAPVKKAKSTKAKNSNAATTKKKNVKSIKSKK